jgi:16S rRNA C1402 (ribose-2'-O) methylase RsmI
MSNDQENIKKIQEKKVHPDALNSLVHQICSEMLTIKKELTELKEEVKLNELRRDDEIGDAFENIKLLKNQNQILIMEMKENRKHRKEVNEHIDSRTGKILSSEEAVTHLGRALLGDNDEKGKE